MNIRKIILSVVVTFVIIIGLSLLGKKSDNTGVTQKPSPRQVATHLVPKGNRLLGIDVNMAEDNNFHNALSAAKLTGTQVVSLAVNWNQFESTPEKYGADFNSLAIANSYYPSQKVFLALAIRPIDTNGKHVPKDLEDKPFDSPEMIRRFEKFLDYVFAQTKDLKIVSFAIGNEVDSGIGTNKQLWREYEIFYKHVVEYAKTKHPEIKFGVTAGLYGLMGSAKEEIQSLNHYSDVVMITYYPMNSDFTFKDPSVVGDEMDALVKIYPDKKIHIREIGYSSSKKIGSSEEKQAEFVKEVFRTWDTYASQIEYISFSWLTDRSKSDLDNFQRYYHLSNDNFREYLGTLGLRTYAGSGTDKAAFKALMSEAKARGW